MRTALQKFNYLLLKINLFEETAVKIHFQDVQAELAKQKVDLEVIKKSSELLLDDSTDKEEVKIEFENQYAVALKQLKNSEDLILDSDLAVETIFSELNIQLHRFIEENRLDDIDVWLKIGRSLFEEGIDINAKNAIFNTPLCHAISSGQLEIATLLLERGACVNSFYYKHRPALYIAIQEKKFEFARLLIQYGAKVNSYQSGWISPLCHAIKLGDINTVEMLVRNGAKINADESAVIVGSTSNFASPLRYALECKQLHIAQFLFDLIKKDSELFQESLNIFLNYAPLELLQNFIEDPSISIENKFATLIITRINFDKSIIRRNSGEIILKVLLEVSDYEKERLAVLKQVIKQLMTIDYLESTVEQESCYADKELFERLAAQDGEFPTKDLAQQLLKSIQDDSPGRVGVGVRLLSDMISYALNKTRAFSLGIKLIEEVVGELNDFYEKNKSWPDEATVNNLIEKAGEKADLSSRLAVRSTPGTAAKRFRAMAGSSIFTNLNPNIPAGGELTDARQWYREIVSIIVNTMAEEGMLSDYWNEIKAQRLLTEICEEPSSSKVLSHTITADQELTKAMGFQLDVPEHFIPVCLFEEQNNWVYTVMCRAFIKTGNGQKRGAVDFIIPKKDLAELFVPLIKEGLKKGGTYQEFDDSATIREIRYRLLKHLLVIEQLTGLRGTYSIRPAQKPFKGPTCFASNIKLILPVMLIILGNPDTTPGQWKKFNDKLKELILTEMSKAKLPLQDSRQTCDLLSDKTMVPHYVTYKLVTTLLRWLEINHFNPANEAERAGKEATVKHVLEHTKRRFKLNTVFFRSTSEMTVNHDEEHFTPSYNYRS